MTRYRPSHVRALLAELDLRPSRVLGQNFLIDGNILQRMLAIIDPRPEDVVLEIGPGLGVLTEPLLARAGRVVAIEKDHRLCRYLRTCFAGRSNFELIEGDALEIDLEQVLAGGVTAMASNLPYAVGSRVLVDLAFAAMPPGRMAVTVQQEVAQRMVAAPGTKAYGVLTVFLAQRYQARVVKAVSPSCFFPKPQVTSALVELVRHPVPAAEPVDPEAFRSLVKHAFAMRRKQLGTILQQAPGIDGCAQRLASVLAGLNIDPTTRPQELPPAAWRGLADALAAQA